MKTVKYFALFLFLTCFVACGSDDDNKGDVQESGAGSFSYDGETYNLKAGIIDNDGTDWSDDNSTEYYFTLFTSELNFDQDGDPIPKDNKLSLLDFNLFSQDANKPKTGLYNFDEDDNVNYTIEDASAIINLTFNTVDGDLEIGDFDELIYATAGKVELHQSGSTYEMDFEFTMTNFTMTNSKVLTGHYKGKMLTFEYDDDWRPAKKSFFKSLKTYLKELKE